MSNWRRRRSDAQPALHADFRGILQPNEGPVGGRWQHRNAHLRSGRHGEGLCQPGRQWCTFWLRSPRRPRVATQKNGR